MITINPKKSLRAEIYIYLLLGSLIPSMIILFIYSKKLHDNLHSVIVNKIEDGNEVVRTDLEFLFDSFKSSTAALAKEDFFIELLGGGEETRDSLARLAAHRKRTTATEIFTIYKIDGTMLVSTDKNKVLQLDNKFLDMIEKKKKDKIPTLIWFSIDNERGFRLDVFVPIIEPFYKYLQGFLQETRFIDRKFIEAIKQKTGLEVGLFNRRKSHIYTSFAPPMLDSSTLQELFQTGNVTIQDTLFIGKNPYHTLLHPVLNENGTVFGAIGLLASEEIIRENLSLVKGLFIYVFLLIIAFSFAVNYYSANRIIKPISNVVKALRKIADRELGQRIKVENQNEISELAKSFNAMAEDLEKTTVSRDYLDNIFKNTHDTLVVITPETIIQMVNYTICDLLGYSEKELIGHPVGMVFSKGETPFKEDSLKDFAKNGFPKNLEKTYVSKFGRKIPVLFSSSAMHNKDGKLQGIVCVAQDITELKLAEQAIKEKEAQLIHADRLISLGEMASGMAHKLKQPLAGIQSNIESLERGLINKTFTDENILKIVKKTSNELDSASHIIGRMYNFASTQEVQYDPIDLVAPINDGLFFFSEQFRLHGIQIGTEFQDGLPKIKADHRQFEQIVVNLLSNARYAVDKRKESEDKGYQKKISLHLYKGSNSNSIFFEVKDNGVGMSPEVVKNCLEPFYTTKEVGEGNGLGLSIVYKIVREFGGIIDIKSEYYVGTKFRIKFNLKNV